MKLRSRPTLALAAGLSASLVVSSLAATALGAKPPHRSPRGRGHGTGRPSTGVATFHLTAGQAQGGRYVAQTKGHAKATNSSEIAGFSLSDALRHGLNLTSGVPNGMAIGFTSPLTNYASAEDPVQMYVNGEPITASIYDDGDHQGYIERYGASLQLRGAPPGPWDGTVSFVLGVRNLTLEALPGFTLGVDVAVTKTQVPNFFGQLVDGFASPFGETPSWASTNLQNTPHSGNLHGRWPLFPNTPDDTGERPITIPQPTTFDTEITATHAGPTGVTLRFSEPVEPNDFGLALNRVSSWSLQWADDHRSVRVIYGERLSCRGTVTVIVFRAVDSDGAMIGGPEVRTVRGKTTGPTC